MSGYPNDPMDLALCGWGRCQSSASEPGVPLCSAHLLTAWRLVDTQLRTLKGTLAESRDETRPVPTPAESLVYYIRFASGIKIGHTSNLLQRVQAFMVMPSDVIACEPGGQTKERFRHMQFQGQRLGSSELFMETPQLTEHMAELRGCFGDPWRVADTLMRRNAEVLDVERFKR